MNAATPFKLTAIGAIIAAGLVAAARAHAPTQPIVWMVAYLVLVVGVVQYALGAGQLALRDWQPKLTVVWGQWLIWNLGHAAVIGGTLCHSIGTVIIGTLLYDIAIIWLAVSVKGGHRCLLRNAYWLLIALMFVSSWIGVLLGLTAN